jgi:hypothetical protein
VDVILRLGTVLELIAVRAISSQDPQIAWCDRPVNLHDPSPHNVGTRLTHDGGNLEQRLRTPGGVAPTSGDVTVRIAFAA